LRSGPGHLGHSRHSRFPGARRVRFSAMLRIRNIAMARELIRHPGEVGGLLQQHALVRSRPVWVINSIVPVLARGGSKVMARRTRLAALLTVAMITAVTLPAQSHK